MPTTAVLFANLVGRAFNNPQAEPEPAASQVPDMLSAARRALARRKSELLRHTRYKGTSGEELSRAILEVRLVDLAAIQKDPGFENTRIYEDVFLPDIAPNEGQKMSDLRTSMDNEGLKVAITVQPLDEGSDQYRIINGFRRTSCARSLGWKSIPAAIVAWDLPLRDAYWFNIIENSTRKSLTTFEIANAARLMRDKFDVKAADFARRTGYSDGHVSKLLSTMDRLQPFLIDRWREGTGLTFDDWYHCSLFDPEQQMRFYRKKTGLPTPRNKELGERTPSLNLAPPKYLRRMQDLWKGIEGSDLQPKTRSLVLMAIEVCMGNREVIPGVYDPRKKKDYEKRAKLRRTLRMPSLPDPGEEGGELPPPAEMSEDDVE